MAKVNIKSEKITPFGGIYYANKVFMRFHLTKSSTFVFHFTAVCAKWTRTARRWWLNLYTGMPYDKLSL